MSQFTPTQPVTQPKPTTPQATQPVQQKPTLFADEQNAYNAMLSD